MANREPFPYDEDWRRDLPLLMETGIIQKIAKALAERHPSDSLSIPEALHCRTVRSTWDFKGEGAPFLNIQYLYPSVIFGENEAGHFSLGDEPLNIDDPAVIARLTELADTRTIETWNPFPDGEFVPAVPIVL